MAPRKIIPCTDQIGGGTCVKDICVERTNVILRFQNELWEAFDCYSSMVVLSKVSAPQRSLFSNIVGMVMVKVMR